MSQLPAYGSFTRNGREPIADSVGLEAGPDVVLESANADSGASPTTLFRKGNVICLRSGTGEYVEANDSNATVSTAPSITTSGHADTKSTIKLVGNHGTISVTVTTGTGTEAECATDLNADADFAAHYTASSGGGELTIAANSVGPQEWFYMHSDTAAGYGFAEGADNGVVGTEADYLVTAEDRLMVDDRGSAQAQIVPTYRRGTFDASVLVNLTAEAKAVLARRGSRFV